MKAILCLLCAVTLWGSSFAAMKIAVTHYHPLFVMAFRMLLASLLFVVVFKRIRNVQYRKGDWKYLCFMAFCEPCLYFLFESYALKYTSSAQAGMITATLPLFMAVGATAVLSEVVSRKTLVGFAISILGVIFLTLSAEQTISAPNPLLGNMLEVAAMLCATGYMLTMKKLSARYNSWFITAFQAFSGAVFFMPALLLSGTPFPETLHVLPSLMIVYLGMIVTIGGYGFYNLGTSMIPASQASAFVNLIPVVAVLFGWAFLGETLTFQQIIASAMVFLGVVVSQDKRSRKKN